MTRSINILVALIFILLLVFRLHLAVGSKHGDMYNNTDWGRIAVTYGLANFYDLPKNIWPHAVANQPPGSILFHSASYLFFKNTGHLLNFINRKISLFPSRLVWWWDEHGELLAIKLPSVLADFAAAGALYYYAAAKSRPKSGLIISLLYLINPVIWYNSSWWGQTDSIIAAFSLWSVVLLLLGKVSLSALFFGLSLVTKASWAPFLPIWLIYVYLIYPAQLTSALIIPAIVLFVSFPFRPYPDLPIYLYHLYSRRILPGESGYITVNAFNFWNLIYPQQLVQETTTIWGIQLKTYSYFLLGLFGIPSAFLLIRRFRPEVLVKVAVTAFFAVFLFASRMHERYLFPVIPLFYLLLLIKSKPVYWLILFVLSLLFLINMYSLWFSPTYPAVIALYTPRFTQAVSLLFILAFLLVFGLQFKYEKAH